MLYALSDFRLLLAGGLLLLSLTVSSCLSVEDPGGGGGSPGIDDLTKHTLSIDGSNRTFWIFHPENAPSGPMPLVLMFHGANGSGAGMSRSIRFNDIAEEHGFIVAYPDALVGNWAEGCGCNNADRLQVKDMTFVEQIIQTVDSEYRMDEQRIYGAGFSQGGLFTARLGCEASNRFRGIVIVAANMSVPLSQNCHPQNPVAVRIIQGTADQVLPYEGSDNGALSLLSAPEAVRFWADRNGVESYEDVSWRPDEEHRVVKVTRYSDPEGNTRRFAELLSVTGQGHFWIRTPWANSEEEILEMVLNH